MAAFRPGAGRGTAKAAVCEAWQVWCNSPHTASTLGLHPTPYKEHSGPFVLPTTLCQVTAAIGSSDEIPAAAPLPRELHQLVATFSSVGILQAALLHASMFPVHLAVGGMPQLVVHLGCWKLQKHDHNTCCRYGKIWAKSWKLCHVGKWALGVSQLWSRRNPIILQMPHGIYSRGCRSLNTAFGLKQLVFVMLASFMHFSSRAASMSSSQGACHLQDESTQVANVQTEMQWHSFLKAAQGFWIV